MTNPGAADPTVTPRSGRESSQSILASQSIHAASENTAESPQYDALSLTGDSPAPTILTVYWRSFAISLVSVLTLLAAFAMLWFSLHESMLDGVPWAESARLWYDASPSLPADAKSEVKAAMSSVSWWLLGMATFIVVLLCWLTLLWRFFQRLQQQLEALNLQAEHVREQSFNLVANRDLMRELRPLAQALRQMTESLSVQRATLHQRELLLDTIIQTSPSAIVLTDSQDRVLLANPAARQLVWRGAKFEGMRWHEVLRHMPPLLHACQQQQSGLVELSAQSIWHLSCHQFSLNQRQHMLYQVKPMTQEWQQAEIGAWKKLLRVIGHELNNSLAPMSSLAFSGQKLLAQQPLDTLALERLFSHLAQRSSALNQFLQGYLQFARLPPPQRSEVNWVKLINELQDHYEFEYVGPLPQRVWLLDVTQLSQLLLNLLKNAQEAGSAVSDIQLQIDESATALRLWLRDAGGGMSDEVLSHALLPFYTTKEGGSGIGLTLCRDIMNSHGGQLQLRNYATDSRQGLEVMLYFPAAGHVAAE